MALPPTILLRTRPLDTRLIDGLIALGLSAWALTLAPVVSDPLQAVLAVAMTAAAAWRRRPVTVVLLVETAGAAALGRGLQWPQGIALLLAVYTAALHSEQRLLVLAVVAALAGLLAAYGIAAKIPAGLAPILLLAPAWLAGVAMRNHQQRADAALARAERLERERADALRAERARIARELHDVVTHSVSLMVMQTGAARQIISQDEQRGLELLHSVETSGRAALDELRRLLGVLAHEHEDVPLSPTPTMSDIPALVAHTSDAGLSVEVHVDGEPRAMPPGAALAAYRIVQEALTNVLKHAPRSNTTVTVRWHQTAVEVEILDDGPIAAVNNGQPAGRGIAGMQERATIYGGTLHAGPRPTGGYRVHARIPLENARR